MFLNILGCEMLKEMPHSNRNTYAMMNGSDNNNSDWKVIVGKF